MEEIKVGEYIRTKDGIISKVTDILKGYCIDCDNDVFDIGNGAMMEIPWEYIKEYVKKHSKNIIDLIEVGDIIEWEYEGFGYDGINEVIDRFDIIGVYGIEYDDTIPLKNITIKRILTHEQFENNVYRIGE